MKLVVLFAILCSLSVSGCASEIGNDYFVIIDPSFSIKYRAAAELALDAWQDALDGDLRITSVSFGNCDASGSKLSDPRKMICVVPTTGAWLNSQGYPDSTAGLTTRYRTTDSSNVFIPIDREEPYDFNYIVGDFTHEFGHAMGLEHTENGIMFWLLQMKSAYITCDDLAQWHDVRGMNDETGRCPNGGSFIPYH